MNSAAPPRHPSKWPARLLVLGLWPLFAQVAVAQVDPPRSAKSETFTLSGSVVNSVTGESVGRALVRIAGRSQRTVFSDAEGHFQVEGLPAGAINVSAQKPGYFTEQQLRQGARHELVTIGPGTDSIVVKLIPQAAISGRVTDSLGLPIERVPVRLTARPLRQGRKHWESNGFQETDEDGQFRFANLMPGTYYLSAGPGRDETRLLPGNETPKTGYASLYYPGVPDLASASPIQLAAGQHAEADFSMAAGPVYHISGRVTGHLADQGVGFQLFNQSGDDLSLPIAFHGGTNTFEVDGVSPGIYVIKGFSQSGPEQPVRGEARVNVAGNVENLQLVLAPAISIPVVVRSESRTSNASAISRNQAPPMTVRLIPANPTTPESYSTVVRGSSGSYSLVLQNVDPGKYSVDLMPQGGWYVQSAQYGQTNLLYDDLSIASTGQTYSMDIVLRDDSATLTGMVKSPDAKATEANILVAPIPASKIPPQLFRSSTQSGFTFSGLAPGEYLVYAFDNVDALEYSRPEALEPYASQAAHVTLSANQKAQVSLDLIHTGDGN